MDSWEREILQRRLADLIPTIDVNPYLLRELESNKLISMFDKRDLDILLETDGHCKAASHLVNLVNISLTNLDEFIVILERCKQLGAVKILVQERDAYLLKTNPFPQTSQWKTTTKFSLPSNIHLKYFPLLDNEIMDDKNVYISDKYIQMGDFNSTVYDGVYKSQKIRIWKVSGVNEEPKVLCEDLAKIVTLSRHDHVLFYHHVELVDQTLILITDETETNLQLCIQNKSFPLEKLNIMYQVVKGLDFLHDNFVTHGSLKPVNILISSAKMVKLANFGLQSAVKNLIYFDVDRGIHVGVLDWMAPEILIFLQDRSYPLPNDPKCDMFSYGCIFYYVISGGMHPFGDLIRRFHNIIENEPSLKCQSTKDEFVVHEISRLLSKEPNKRPSAAEMLKLPAFSDST